MYVTNDLDKTSNPAQAPCLTEVTFSGNAFTLASDPKVGTMPSRSLPALLEEQQPLQCGFRHPYKART